MMEWFADGSPRVQYMPLRAKRQRLRLQWAQPMLISTRITLVLLPLFVLMLCIPLLLLMLEAARALLLAR